MIVRECSSITSAHLGDGGLCQNANTADAGKWVGAGGMKKFVPKAKINVKMSLAIFEIII